MAHSLPAIPPLSSCSTKRLRKVMYFNPHSLVSHCNPAFFPAETTTVKVTGKFLLTDLLGSFHHLLTIPFLKHFLPLISIILTSFPFRYFLKVLFSCLPSKYESFPHGLVLPRPSSLLALYRHSW